ncbi:unnamed protein product [Rhodiola kirilowii]
MAACLIKLKRFNEAIGHCSLVLAEDEDNAKALFRRGRPNQSLGRTDAAVKIFSRHGNMHLRIRRLPRSYEYLLNRTRLFTRSKRRSTKDCLDQDPSQNPSNPTRWSSFGIGFWHCSLVYSSSSATNKAKKTD